MLKILLLSVVATVGFAATTIKPHHSHASHNHHGTGPTHEPDEHHGYNFHYDHNSNMMAMRVGKHCYLQELTSQQQIDVHTSHGLVAIEKSMIDKLDMGAQTAPVNTDGMSKAIAHLCPTKFTTVKFV
uniref:DUF732 domain-containing protein n=1 Tax=Pinctada fucata TaxID=50426 RepID=A0A194AMT9_PINFU